MISHRPLVIVTPAPPPGTASPSSGPPVIRPTTASRSEDAATEAEEEETTTSRHDYDDDSEDFGGEVGTTAKFEQLKRNGKDSTERHSAELSFKERLKERFKKFRQEHVNILSSSKKDEKKESTVRPTFTRNRHQEVSRERVASEENEDEEEEEKNSRRKFGKSGRTDLIRRKLAEVLKHTTVAEESTLQRTFVPSLVRPRPESQSSTQTRVQPTNVRNLFNIDASTRSPFSFHRNKGFKRPTIRKNFLNRVLGKSSEEVTEPPSEEAEENIAPSVTVTPSSVTTSEVIFTKPAEPAVSIVTPTVETAPKNPAEDDDDQEEEQVSLQSSIEEAAPAPATVTPTAGPVSATPRLPEAGDESTIRVTTEQRPGGARMEVATIQSAYSFTVGPGDLMSTRYTIEFSNFVIDVL